MCAANQRSGAYHLSEKGDSALLGMVLTLDVSKIFCKNSRAPWYIATGCCGVESGIILAPSIIGMFWKIKCKLFQYISWHFMQHYSSISSVVQYLLVFFGICSGGSFVSFCDLYLYHGIAYIHWRPFLMCLMIWSTVYSRGLLLSSVPCPSWSLPSVEIVSGWVGVKVGSSS